ncbi:glycosyltransferase family 2 protein [Aeromicrobium sp.]|nr:glycosyltransferase family 2 protein [Candidatus Saccharibacteria bacterium]
MQKHIRISLVIPVYNEESYLAACLRSALAQRQPFDEVIVVDNNSSDATARIVSQFPGVRLLYEPRQGVVHARNRGFDAASGEVIARIDADTRLPDDWTMQLTQSFAVETTAAVTGQISYYETALPRLLSASDSSARRAVAFLLGRNMALQGANMALRRSVWLDVRGAICTQAGAHEDFDLAIHAVEQGHAVMYDADLHAEVAFRQAASTWRAFANYYWHCPKTYLDHGIMRGYWFVPVAFSMVVAYPLLHGLRRISMRQKWSQPLTVRVNPATFVD